MMDGSIPVDSTQSFITKLSNLPALYGKRPPPKAPIAVLLA